ncbi:hypothetical protein EN933_37045, partial [Mesorhizobium sp. M7A.F.Ca.US.001.01.1.1]
MLRLYSPRRPHPFHSRPWRHTKVCCDVSGRRRGDAVQTGSVMTAIPETATLSETATNARRVALIVAIAFF